MQAARSVSDPSEDGCARARRLRRRRGWRQGIDETVVDEAGHRMITMFVLGRLPTGSIARAHFVTKVFAVALKA